MTLTKKYLILLQLLKNKLKCKDHWDWSKIPSITGLAATAALTAVENKVPDYDAKILDIELKYFTTSDYNKFTNQIIGNKVKEITLINK